ncbi:MAG: hypothetical protein HFF26_06475 [Oscillospiraceae bacterium]|nr:hypothetical protein [Oscillospiraceae bacterium]
MNDYVSVFQYKNNVGISFDVEAEKPFHVGEQMNAAHEMAYMNGYNWAALLDWYLGQTAPELLEGLEHDPEAGSYAGYYLLSPENEAKAEKVVALIRALVENEAEACRLVREHGDEIEWD